MRCEEVELSLVEDPAGAAPEVASHLATCAACRAFAAETAQVLELAALPPLTVDERAALATLERRTFAGWRSGEASRRGWRRWAGYALAAGVGALVASGAWAWRQPAPPAEPSRVVQVRGVEVASADFGSGSEWDAAADDEVASADEFLEVSWPAVEGETP